MFLRRNFIATAPCSADLQVGSFVIFHRADLKVSATLKPSRLCSADLQVGSLAVFAPSYQNQPPLTISEAG